MRQRLPTTATTTTLAEITVGVQMKKKLVTREIDQLPLDQPRKDPAGCRIWGVAWMWRGEAASVPTFVRHGARRMSTGIVRFLLAPPPFALRRMRGRCQLGARMHGRTQGERRRCALKSGTLPCAVNAGRRGLPMVAGHRKYTFCHGTLSNTNGNQLPISACHNPITITEARILRRCGAPCLKVENRWCCQPARGH